MGVLTINVFPDGMQIPRLARKTGVIPQDASAATTLFTVTGDVIIRIFGICKTSCTTSDAITLEVGTSTVTAAFIAQIADATDLLINEIWWDATPTSTYEQQTNALLYGVVVSNGQDIILTPSGTFTAGSIDFYCTWIPLSADGKVEAA